MTSRNAIGTLIAILVTEIPVSENQSIRIKQSEGYRYKHDFKGRRIRCFYKMSGDGNDLIMIDDRRDEIAPDWESVH